MSLVYLSFILLFAVVSFNQVFLVKGSSYKKGSFVWVICLVLLIIHDGLRWETGTDWDNYLYFFNSCLTNSSNLSSDLGYLYLNQLVYILTNKYTYFLLLHAIIVYCLLFNSVRKYSVYPFLSLFLYYCMMLPYLGMNRQFLALGFCFFSVRYVIQRQLFKFLCCVVVATLFHKTAFVFIIAYVLNKEYSKFAYIGGLVLALLISFSGLTQQIPTVALLLLDDVSAYKVQVYSSSSFGQDSVNIVYTILSILKKSIWLIPFIFLKNYAKRTNGYSVIFVNIYFLSLLFYVIFNNTALQIFVSRGLLYFNIAEIIIIPSTIALFKANYSRLVFFSLLLIYSYLNLSKGLASYRFEGMDDIFVPYKGLFINSDYHREMF